MVNSVAFYQIAKLGIILFTATVEATFFRVQKDPEEEEAVLQNG